MKKLLIVAAVIATIPAVALAVPSPKYFVCKYVGTPGVNEHLQTGQNPISVNGNALTPPIVVGAYFNDAQGRSYVVAADTGQDEPDCPLVVNQPNDPVIVVPDTPRVTPKDTPKVETVAPVQAVEALPQFEGK